MKEPSYSEKACNHSRSIGKVISSHQNKMEIADELGDKEKVGKTHGNMENAVDDKEKYRKAMDGHRKALRDCRGIGGQRRNSKSLQKYGKCLLLYWSIPRGT